VAGRSYREYAAEGACGQFVTVMPETDTVVGVNAGLSKPRLAHVDAGSDSALYRARRNRTVETLIILSWRSTKRASSRPVVLDEQALRNPL
jgi:hypothetical protein